MKKIGNITLFFERVIMDDQLYPSHVSMYFALFQFWSQNKFQNPFRICREEIMKISKIKSLATYHKCIKELCQSGFITYLPSYNSYLGSLVEMMDFEPEGREFLVNQKEVIRERNFFSIPTFWDVELYFKERDVEIVEADKFYSYYTGKNWKLINKHPMKCWQAAARNWITKIKKYRSNGKN